MKKFTVFGKKDCGLCKNRLDFVESYQKRFDAEYEIQYLDVEEPIGLVQFAKVSGASEVPCVTLEEDGTIVKFWSGAKDFPNTREMNSIFGTSPIEPNGAVKMVPAKEIKRYNSANADLTKHFEDAIEKNRIEDKDGQK